jgi:hypothetical protein
MAKLLFRSEAERRLGFVDQAPHVTNAFGAAHLRLAMAEDVKGLGGACIHGGSGFAFSNAVAVADVQGRPPIVTRSLTPPPNLLQLIRKGIRNKSRRLSV